MPSRSRFYKKNPSSSSVTAFTGDKKKVLSAGIPIGDKAAKRVIAPFVRIIRKDQKLQEVEEAKHFSAYLRKKPSVLIRDLSSFLSDSVDLVSLLHETSDVLKNATKAAGVTLYMMDPTTNEIYQSRKTPLPDRYKIRWKIKHNTTVAAYVAYKKDYVMVDDIIEDDRFPEGVGYESDTVKAVLCIPVVTPDGECFAVIELYKLLFDKPFAKVDLSIGLIVTGWMGAAIHQNSRRLALQRQQELNDYLLEMTKCYFGESVFTEKMISEVVKFIKATLNAERGSMFVIDRDSGDDMVADFYDEGCDEDPNATKKPQKVRFTKDRGIASLVARTGITVNVKDAYNDTRFNKEIDQKTGFIARSILCMPIVGPEGILGVLQVVNKKQGGHFSVSDEKLFATFCTYCALALRFSKVRRQLKALRHFNVLFLNIVQLLMKPCVHDLQFVEENRRIPAPSGFNHLSWYISNEDHNKMPQFCLYMFCQIIKRKELNLDTTIKYILSVRKFYRRIPYHNFEHAFNVCHCIYMILRVEKNRFSNIEKKGLLLGALSHDLDHPGFSNNFLELTRDDLSFLYESSILENHHFYVAMLLLDHFEIFNSMSVEDYAALRQQMKEAIIATDLQVYIGNKTKLEGILKRGTFNWEIPEHRYLIKSIMMTTADLSGNCKPFLVSKALTDNLYGEFYRQGDLEKEVGLCPLSLMDREKTNVIPEDQVNFMSIIVLPCLEMVRQLVPSTEVLYTEAKHLTRTWQEIIDIRGKKVYRQDDSFVEKRFVY